ncbi:AfsR/SARP family transcriptional regulator [Lentzea sp. NPDC054927]
MTDDLRPDEMMVCVLGEFAVHHAGRVRKAGDVGSRKARVLLVMLAVHEGWLTADRIASRLWGDRPPRDSRAGVATLVSRLRGVLGSGAIIGGRDGYRLASAVRVDLTLAAGMVDEAVAHLRGERPGSALAATGQAMTWLDAAVVEAGEQESGWLAPTRAWHERLLRRARHARADAALAVGENRVALEAAEAAVRADPFDEVACRLVMCAYRAAGEPVRALLAGDRLRATLAAEFGVDPAPATRELYLAILRDPAQSRQPAHI